MRSSGLGIRRVGLALAVAVLGTGLAAAQTQTPESSKPASKVPSDEAIREAAREAFSGRLDASLKRIRDEAGKHPEWSPPRIILARILFASDRAPVGRRVLEQAAVELPEHPDVYLSFGALALGDGRLSDARLNFEKARTLIDGGEWPATKRQNFHREADSGMAAVAEGREDWKTARRELTSLLDIAPKDAGARQRLGRALFRLGKPDEAFHALQQAASDAPDSEPPAVAMGWLYQRAGNALKAEEWFQRAIKDEPKNARVHRDLANWLVDQGRPVEAHKAIETAADLEPGSTDTERLRAVIAWHLGDPAGSQRILEPLQHKMPGDFAINNLMALCLADQDDQPSHARALQLAEQNFRQAPRSPDALATLGWTLYRAGRVDQAEQVLRQAVTGNRATPDVAYYLARTLADKGREDDARNLLRSATGFSGAFAHRQAAEELLKSLNP